MGNFVEKWRVVVRFIYSTRMSTAMDQEQEGNLAWEEPMTTGVSSHSHSSQMQPQIRK